MCEFNETNNDGVDESQLSPSELYEKGQREMEDAQKEAEDWADENDMNSWSDGTPRNSNCELQEDVNVEASSETDNVTDGIEGIDEEVFANEVDAEPCNDADNKQGYNTEFQEENIGAIEGDDNTTPEDVSLQEQEYVKDESINAPYEYDDTNNDYGKENLNQQKDLDDVKQESQNEINFENISDDELYKKYKDTKAQSAALGDQYKRYDEQIGEISRDKQYYSEKDWNSRMDEKINAQNDVTTRQYQIKGEINRIEKELERRRK